MKKKMKMTLKNEAIYGVNRFYPASPEAEALFSLIYPRAFLTPDDMKHIVKMGFYIEFVGNLRGLFSEGQAQKIPFEYDLENGRIVKVSYHGE